MIKQKCECGSPACDLEGPARGAVVVQLGDRLRRVSPACAERIAAPEEARADERYQRTDVAIGAHHLGARQVASGRWAFAESDEGGTSSTPRARTTPYVTSGSDSVDHEHRRTW